MQQNTQETLLTKTCVLSGKTYLTAEEQTELFQFTQVVFIMNIITGATPGGHMLTCFVSTTCLMAPLVWEDRVITMVTISQYC